MANKRKREELNPKQEKFCHIYATDKEFFGNGVESYIEVYKPNKSNPNWYKNACSSASQLLSNTKVFTRINELLEETGFSDAFADKQLGFLMAQQSDFTNKLGAIREFNKLKKRITEKMDLTSGGEKIQPILGGSTNGVSSHNGDAKVAEAPKEA